jgi:hypothetical protein
MTVKHANKKRMGTGVSSRTPIQSDSEKPTRKTVGGWTEQDLTNPKILSDARALAVVATQNIQDERGLQFHFSNPTIDVTDLQSQVVNGTNYRIEYVIEDSDGDHVMFVTALMYRSLQDPITRAQVVSKDYAIENVNRADKKQPTTKLDKTSTIASSTTQKRQHVRRHGGR